MQINTFPSFLIPVSQGQKNPRTNQYLIAFILHTYSETSALRRLTFGDNDPENFIDDSVLQFKNF